ncbi:aconitase family protein [Patescibacteria group bacterium]|nr:aconitase family protein [Patescibacteria group bacterium]
MTESGNRYVSDEILDLAGARIFYLTRDPNLIEQQLDGIDIEPVVNNDLLDRVSTDTYPTRACFRFEPSYMAEHAFTGISLGPDKTIPPSSIKNAKFDILAAGKSFGMGSSREHFVWSLKEAGIKLIIASSIEEICRRNLENIGLPYITGDVEEIISQILIKQKIGFDDLTQNMDSITQQVVRQHGLFTYLSAVGNLEALPKPNTANHPMTGPEKIIAAHMGVDAVKPGDVGFVDLDYRVSYEIFLPMSISILRRQMPNSKILDPGTVLAFYDHSVLDLNFNAQSLGKQMRETAQQEGFVLYDGDYKKGTRGICHTVLNEEYALPGQILGITDSHAPTAGVTGALPIGMGSTEMAGALRFKKSKITIPESILITLEGHPNPSVMSKDVVLYIMSQLKNGEAANRICEYTGPALDYIDFEEQSVLTNMVPEIGGFTGWIRPNQRVTEYLELERKIPHDELVKMLVYSDQNAEYKYYVSIDTSKLEPYVALPGNPRDSWPLSQVLQDNSIDKNVNKVVIGACTGGKLSDWRAAAEILINQKVNPKIQLFVYPASTRVKNKADREGLTEIIYKAGGIILPSACGACVNFGPGSVSKGERAASTTNRNFPGRMGQGDVFLVNARIAAATAIYGSLATPEML